jgi:hypothetical protein
MIGRFIGPANPESSTTETIYRDIPLGDPLTPWATLMWQEGLITSCRADRLAFCPDEGFSRAEAAKTFLELLKGPAYLPTPPQGLFADLSVDDWRTWWVEAAYAEGLMQPCVDTTSLEFCPDEVISRAQAADLLAMVESVNAPGARAGVGEGTPLGSGKTASPRATNR